MTVNGFIITKRLAGSNAEYYQAKRGMLVYTSKSLSYLIKKVNSRTKE